MLKSVYFRFVLLLLPCPQCLAAYMRVALSAALYRICNWLYCYRSCHTLSLTYSITFSGMALAQNKSSRYSL